MRTFIPTTQLGPDPVHRYIRGIHYPSSREKVAMLAREHGAPDEMIEIINHMPQKRFYAPEELIHSFEEQDRMKLVGT